jgi:hypothetical protein
MHFPIIFFVFATNFTGWKSACKDRGVYRPKRSTQGKLLSDSKETGEHDPLFLMAETVSTDSKDAKK